MGKIRRKSNKKLKLKGLKKPKRKRMCYREEHVSLALKEINDGEKIASVSRKYNIPESTLRAKKQGLYANKKPGPATVLKTDEEKELTNWIFECSRLGFPVTRSQLRESVKLICDCMNRKTPFTDNLPGRCWFEGFLRRHPDVAERITENLSLSRAKIKESCLTNWFTKVSNYLSSNNLLEIEPNRIFNSAETGISVHVNSPSVLVPKGCKNTSTTVENNENQNIAVVITGNAAGDLAPSFIVFKGNHLLENTAKLSPPEFGFGYSDNGFILAKNYFEYIVTFFEPWLTEKQIKRPVILYIDGRLSHFTLNLNKFCSVHGIVLIVLHPNAAQILQPWDVNLFQELKKQWQRMHNFGIYEYQFAPLLKQTYDSINVKEILQNGFKKTGLYPFDRTVIDMTKVLSKNKTQEMSYDNVSNETSSTLENVNKLKEFESLLSLEQLESFKMNESETWNGNIEDKNLFKIWYNLAYPNLDIMTVKTDTLMVSDVFTEYDI